MGVGGLFLRDCCLAYPSDRIACFHPVGNQAAVKWDESLSGIDRHLETWTHEPAYRSLHGKLGAMASFVDEQITRRFRYSPLLKAALRYSEHVRPEVIWAVLDSPVIYRLAHDVAKRLSLPLVSSVWDPPEAVCGGLQWGRRSRDYAQRDYEQTLRASERIGAISENMQAEYTQEFGRPNIVMRHTADSIGSSVRNLPASSETIIIGFCGSIYAADEWAALERALQLTNWKVAGKPVSIWVFGQAVKLSATCPADVKFWGWRSQAEVLEQLSHAHIGYLPYWFASNRSESVRLCFPTKLGTYLSSGLPIFFHGPRNSSVTSFLQKYPAGICCHSLEPAEIAAALETAFCDNRAYESMVANGRQVIETVLSRDLFFRRFAELIGVPETSLSYQ